MIHKDLKFVVSHCFMPTQVTLPKKFTASEEREHVGMRYRELMEKREMVYEIAARYGARNLRVFGSVARGDEIPESDIDILVDMEAGRSLLDLGGLLMELKDVFGCEVDVVTVQGLRERLRERVLKEAVPL